MMIEVHLLQNLAPSNVNRDENGAPKATWFGGQPRHRVSSQAWKRAIRERWRGTVDPSLLAIRTRRVVDALRPYLADQPREEVAGVVSALFATSLKMEGEAASYLLFLSTQEWADLAALCRQHWDLLRAVATASTAKKEAPKLPAELRQGWARALAQGKAIDLALFGRMIADHGQAHIEAACSVAHAISVNRIPASDVDFFTAVDDLQPAGETGAAMVGQTEFVSSCLYRYACLDSAQLLANLGQERNLADQALRAFLDAFVRTVPGGKAHSMATFTPPSLVLGVAREGAPCQLSNAFARPVRASAERSMLEAAAEALDAYWAQVMALYGQEDVRRVVLAQVEPLPLSHLSQYRVPSLDEWIDTLARETWQEVAL
jgi:CRISPR system Cascade subunit CasC